MTRRILGRQQKEISMAEMMPIYLEAIKFKISISNHGLRAKSLLKLGKKTNQPKIYYQRYL